MSGSEPIVCLDCGNWLPPTKQYFPNINKPLHDDAFVCKTCLESGKEVTKQVTVTPPAWWQRLLNLFRRG